MGVFKSVLLLFSLVVLLFISKSQQSSTDFQCLDEYGNAVDWWVMQKQPVLTSTTGRFKEGLAYSYADVNSQSLTLSTKWLNDTNTALSYTLNQIYKNYNADDAIWLMYNDQPPEEGSSNSDSYESSSDGQGPVTSSYAHSKGTLAFGEDNGFWLIHSVPRFPDDPHQRDYWYPSYEVKNGQSFLCVSYSTYDNFEKIADKLFINRPYIYSYSLPSKSIGVSVQTIQDLIDGNYQESPATDDNSLYSLGGTKFVVFAKNKQWNQDLYENLLQNTLNQNMLVTSWRLGANSTIMPTFCTPTYTYDSVNTMNFVFAADGSGDKYTWKYTKDHSKWAISFQGADEAYVCIGDINRMYSQYKRGGGSACFVNYDLWQSYYNTISAADYCKN